MLTSISQLIGVASSWVIWRPWREIFLVYHSLLNDLWPRGWCCLRSISRSLCFYPKAPLDHWSVLAPFLSLVPIVLYTTLLTGNHMQDIRPIADFLRPVENPARILEGGCILAFLVLLGVKSSIPKTSDARRRMAVMMAGCAFSLIPLLLLILSEVELLPPFPVWLITICLLMLVFFPIAMAYVIVVQRAMDLRMVIRSGVRYGLASTGVKIVRTLLITAAEMIKSILERVDAFTAGAPQHDDMTLVIVRVE